MYQELGGTKLDYPRLTLHWLDVIQQSQKSWTYIHPWRLQPKPKINESTQPPSVLVSPQLTKSP